MTKWATPLALTRGLLSGLCLCWLSYTSLEGTERGPSPDRTLTPDVVEAIRLAAEQGYADGQYNLGVMYDRGEGVPQDDAEAVRWYRLAAEQGYAEVQFNLGVRYTNGRGVPQDYVVAHMWFNLAGAQSSGDARAALVKGRDAVEAKMTPEQIAEAQRLAREWKPTVEP